MKKHYLILLIALLIPLIAIQSNVYAFGQENQDTTEVVAEEEEDMLASSNMWDLVGEAGNIRYPIFAILVIGLFLIGLKSFDLYKDGKKSNSLMNTPFPDLNLDQMVKTLERQPDNMLSRVMAKLINVFQTNKNADYLHDEITNYNRLQQDNFKSFKNRIDFLSDTAGALGLLGTVWGMFMVFSSGNLEKESILAGMGIALMSTLLGLIVSIILNFSSTLTEGFFSKRLEKVTDKADEMRFRLIELSDVPASYTAPAGKTPVHSERINSHNQSTTHAAIRSEINDEKSKPAKNKNPKQDSPPPEKPANKPAMFQLKSELNDTYKAGEEIKEIKFQLMGTNDEPISGEPIEIVLMHAGKVNGKSGNDKVKTDANGIFSFNWALYEKTGIQKAGIRVADNKFKKIKKEISVEAEAAEPKVLQILNNHQAAETGKKISKPIVAVVKDEYENPVEGVSVTMKVTMGNGTFENGKDSLSQKTDSGGKVETEFKLGDEPGFNAVDIDLDTYPLNKKFQAVGQEVTV